MEETSIQLPLDCRRLPKPAASDMMEAGKENHIMDYEKTGALIQAARIEKEMTQAQLAELLGITDKAISKWERRKSFPDVTMLDAAERDRASV